MHDARGHLVLVRFRAVNDALEVRSGLLALTRSPGGAKELADGVAVVCGCSSPGELAR